MKNPGPITAEALKAVRKMAREAMVLFRPPPEPKTKNNSGRRARGKR